MRQQQPPKAASRPPGQSRSRLCDRKDRCWLALDVSALDRGFVRMSSVSKSDLANMQRGVRARPQGRAPRGFGNWDAEEGVWRNDEGLAVPSPDELLKMRYERKRANEKAKRQARSKEQTLAALSAAGARQNSN